jgi:hypothetical protein
MHIGNIPMAFRFTEYPHYREKIEELFIHEKALIRLLETRSPVHTTSTL